MQVKLTKLSDEVFNGDHPNGINPGYIREGELTYGPVVGEICFLDMNFHTSMVTEILETTSTFIKFTTSNSTYLLEYLN